MLWFSSMITKILETGCSVVRTGDDPAVAPAVVAAAVVGGAGVDTGVDTGVGTAGADAPQAVATSEHANPRPAAAARRRAAGRLTHRLTSRG